MGRKPSSNITQNSQERFIPVGKRVMLHALKSTLERAQDGTIKAEEYHFKLVTADSQHQLGRTTNPRIPTANDILMLVNNLRNIFEEVEAGLKREEDYFFELVLSNFYYTSGNYHPLEQLQSTLIALNATYEIESGNIERQRNNVSVLVALMRSNNLEVPPIPNFLEAANNGIREQNDDIVTGVALVELVQASILLNMLKNCFESKCNSSPTTIGRKSHLNVLQDRCFGGNWSYIFMIELFLVVSVQVLPVGAFPVNPEEEQPLTLTAGSDGVVPFKYRNEHQSALMYYTVTIEGKDRPFYLDGTLDPEGLMSPDQAKRFSVEYVERDDSMAIEISITSVSVQDQGTYIVMLIVQAETSKYLTMKRVVMIFIPPGPAICFIERSNSKIKPFEVHCHSEPGSGDSTLSCFQNGDKIPYYHNHGEHGEGDQIVHRRSFWLMDANASVSCCSHDVAEMKTITEALCNQFKLPQTQRTNEPVKIEEFSTENALATRVLSNEEEKLLPSPQTAVHSGSAQSFHICPNLILLILTLITIRSQACLYNI